MKGQNVLCMVGHSSHIVQGKKPSDPCVVPTAKFCCSGVMVWGAMSYTGTGSLCTIQKTETSGVILTSWAIRWFHLLTWVYGNNCISQDDNATMSSNRICESVEGGEWCEIMELACSEPRPQSNWVSVAFHSRSLHFFITFTWRQ